MEVCNQQPIDAILMKFYRQAGGLPTVAVLLELSVKHFAVQMTLSAVLTVV